MDLDELKKVWEDANPPGVKGKLIPANFIDKVTKESYQSGLKKIAYPEMIGTVISFAAAIYLLVSFAKFQSLFLQITAVFVILFLIIFPLTSLVLLSRLHRLTDTSRPFADTLRLFNQQKIRYYKFQELCTSCSYLFLGALVLLLPPITGKKLNDDKYLWTVTIVVGYVFLYFFSRWVLKHYKKALQQSQQSLQELED